MGRSIPELIAAAFAGDSITPAEAKRIQRHIHHVGRIDQVMLRNVSAEVQQRSADVSLAEGFAEYRKDTLRNLLRYTVPELRGQIRELLVLCGWFVELQASDEGRDRRQQRQRQRGIDHAARQKQQSRDELRREMDALHAKHPARTPRALARLYLSRHDSDWDGLNPKKKAQRIETLLRRLRRQKKIGHS